MGKVTVVIPTYFAGKMLDNCINSIFQHSGNVQLLAYKNDIGWLNAANEAMASLTTDIRLINDDILATSDLVKELTNLAYSDDTIGIVGGKSLLPNNPEMIQNYGIYIAPDGNTAHRYFGEPKDSVGVEKQRAVEGSCWYIRREVIEKIGLMDPAYGQGYRAEVDYCFKAREAGFKIVSSPKAEYVHLTSQTMGRLGVENDTYDYFMGVWGRKLKLGLI